MRPYLPRLSAALALSAGLIATSAPGVRAADGEPLPSGAPTRPYELAAWCYGAMSEYLIIYDKVKPDLRDIDKMFGSSVKDEKEPYQDDIAAARQELKILAGAVEAAEKASPQVIAPQGVEAVKTGRSIWGPVETGTHRELARAWMSWGLPDRCDANAKELSAKSALLGQVLKYNQPSATDTPSTAPPDATPATAPDPAAAPAPPPAPAPDATPMPPKP